MADTPVTALHGIRGVCRLSVFARRCGCVGPVAALIWGRGSGQYKGANMRIWIAIGMLMATTVAAQAIIDNAVPEIDAFSGMAAMGVVGSIAALIWERRRRK
jgi:hypothetical protein